MCACEGQAPWGGTGGEAHCRQSHAGFITDGQPGLFSRLLAAPYSNISTFLQPQQDQTQSFKKTWIVSMEAVYPKDGCAAVNERVMALLHLNITGNLPACSIALSFHSHFGASTPAEII